MLGEASTPSLVIPSLTHIWQSFKLTMTLFSFYTLPSTVMNHPTHSSIKVKSCFIFCNNFQLLSLQAAYSFYNVSTATPWVDLMGDALVSQQTNLSGFGCCKILHYVQLMPPCPFYLIQCASHTFTYMLSDPRCLLKERTLMSSTPWISWRTGVVVNYISLHPLLFGPLHI